MQNLSSVPSDSNLNLPKASETVYSEMGHLSNNREVAIPDQGSETITNLFEKAIVDTPYNQIERQFQATLTNPQQHVEEKVRYCFSSSLGTTLNGEFYITLPKAKPIFDLTKAGNTFFRAKVALDKNGEIKSDYKAVEYEVLKTLGSGNYKTAFTTKKMTKDTIKVITYPKEKPTRPADIKDAENEKQINEFLYTLKKVHKQNPPHIVTVAKVTLPGSGDIVGFKGEYANGGSLDKRLGSLNPKQRQFVALEMLTAMEEMHELKLLHRDIKADNFVTFLDSNNEITKVKITDMGKATFVKDPTAPKVRESGSLYWCLMPPETLVDSKTHLENYDKRSDIYQMGVALWQVLCDIPVENVREAMGDTSKDFDIKRALPFANAPESWRGMDTLDENVRNCILLMRDPDPEKRPTLEEVRRVIKEMGSRPQKLA